MWVRCVVCGCGGERDCGRLCSATGTQRCGQGAAGGRCGAVNSVINCVLGRGECSVGGGAGLWVRAGTWPARGCRRGGARRSHTATHGPGPRVYRACVVAAGASSSTRVGLGWCSSGWGCSVGCLPPRRAHGSTACAGIALGAQEEPTPTGA